jgi:hypothetical protein
VPSLQFKNSAKDSASAAEGRTGFVMAEWTWIAPFFGRWCRVGIG